MAVISPCSVMMYMFIPVWKCGEGSQVGGDLAVLGAVADVALSPPQGEQQLGHILQHLNEGEQQLGQVLQHLCEGVRRRNLLLAGPPGTRTPPRPPLHTFPHLQRVLPRHCRLDRGSTRSGPPPSHFHTCSAASWSCLGPTHTPPPPRRPPHPHTSTLPHLQRRLMVVPGLHHLPRKLHNLGADHTQSLTAGLHIHTYSHKC